MPVSPILQNDGPVSFPSMPTLHGGDPNALGRIDHYDLLRKLGGGGFGVVYLARDTVSGVEVALKTLHPLLKSNAEEMDALREKFALVSRLTHTNIAKALVLHRVHDLNIWDETTRKEMRLSPGDSVMVMDYAPGVTLSRWRRQFPDGIVPLDLALEIARQVASALDYAHGERIVHRDIKPGNIMVETLRADEPRGASDHEVDAAPRAASGRQDDEKTRRQDSASETFGGRGSISRHPVISSSRRPLHVRVRLLDFGLAAEIRSSMSRVSTEQGDTSGTRPYMAPEQWLGKKQDGRTDQYALACVLYEMLSGAPPFSGVFETGDPMIMMATVKGETPDEIEDVPEAVNAAILRALSKTPKDRFASCAAFVEALLPETRKPDIPEARTTDAGRARSPSAPQNDGARRPGEPLDAAALEADVLRRKISLERALAALSDEDKKDVEFSTFCSDAELEFTAAKEAIDRNRFSAASRCLHHMEAALEQLRQAKLRRKAREEAERKTREEAERKEREEAERKERKEAERKAAEERARREAERKAREEAARKEREEVERKAAEERARHEAERKAREEAARKEREEAERKAAEERARREAERKARKDAEARRPAGERNVVTIAPGVEMALRWCPATTSETWRTISGGDDFFWMGSPNYETGRSEDEKLHPVRLTRGFWMGETPITQGQWEAIVGNNPSQCLDGKNWLGFGGKTSPNRPVETVSWNDCQEFLRVLNEKTPVSGFTWRLPTEAQWEYACRAGTIGFYAGTGRLDDIGWFDGNSIDNTNFVGQKKPNAWGICDMHGNVWEWISDWYGSYPTKMVTDPVGVSSGVYRVLRGGSCWSSPLFCRSATRRKSFPGNSNWDRGFRLVAFEAGSGHP